MPLERHVARIDLVALAGLSYAHARDLAIRISRRVAVPCRIVDASPIPLQMLAGRETVDADALLAGLEARATPNAVLVGVIPEDIATPIFTFVFGRAREGGSAAIVSLARLDPTFYGLPRDPDLLGRRATTEIVHELGHVAWLRHCADNACLMHFAGSVEKLDVRGSRFCTPCAARLPPWLRQTAT